MPLPKAYEPESGYRYHILCRYGVGAYEHFAYATDHKDKASLIEEGRLAYGAGWRFKAIMQPMKYWPRRVRTATKNNC